MAQDQLQNAQNFLVPALGSTRMYSVRRTLVAGEIVPLDFRTVNMDGRPFIPYSVIIDNHTGTADLIVTVSQTGFRVVCRAGETLQIMYPAPTDQQIYIEGEGDVVVIFTDYPVMPFYSAASLSNEKIQEMIDNLAQLVTLQTAANALLTQIQTNTARIP